MAGAPPVSVDDYTRRGRELGWQFNDNWQLTFDAQNLLDEEYFQYFGDEEPAGEPLHDRSSLSGCRCSSSSDARWL